MSEYISDPIAIKKIVQPFLENNLLLWKGLPLVSIEIFSEAIGKPTEIEEAELGWYPAERYTFEVKSRSGGIAGYVRNGEVLLIEALKAPPLAAMKGLGEPTAILPHEILVQNTYVHEYLYCERGLVLSVAEPFQKELPLRIVRCRGIRPMRSPDEFGPEYYQSFEDKTVWY